METTREPKIRLTQTYESFLVETAERMTSRRGQGDPGRLLWDLGRDMARVKRMTDELLGNFIAYMRDTEVTWSEIADIVEMSEEDTLKHFREVAALPPRGVWYDSAKEPS